MDNNFYTQLQKIISNQSEEIIKYWLEYFDDDDEKDDAYRYYDDFLGFFEECLLVQLDINSDEREAMLLFLTKLQETIGMENFYQFKNSVYSCYLKFPILKIMEKESLFTLENVSVITTFFENLTSALIMQEYDKNTKFKIQSSEELAQREAPMSELWDEVFMVSIVGTLDSDRVLKIIDKVLDFLEQKESSYVIIDIGAIFDINSEVTNQILKLNNAVHFMGATPMLTGITKNIAKSLTHLDISLGDIKTFSSTRTALKAILDKNS
ncbi:RsbR, positive regulator of sigma-B [hydrothermal vent metagenome]|uniref:RsbR, positive regulator of sigma-B n=1 Tax=hydrothermal vent metagenome TaxID=652676 RepID=A0A1W1D3S6_9ZZZZ